MRNESDSHVETRLMFLSLWHLVEILIIFVRIWNVSRYQTQPRVALSLLTKGVPSCLLIEIVIVLTIDCTEGLHIRAMSYTIYPQSTEDQPSDLNHPRRKAPSWNDHKEPVHSINNSVWFCTPSSWTDNRFILIRMLQPRLQIILGRKAWVGYFHEKTNSATL